MGPPSARSRHKFHSGNSWWKPIVLIWRRCPFGVNGANLLIPVSWPNRSRVHEGFGWRNWRKPRPKPRRSFFGLIDDEGNCQWGSAPRRKCQSGSDRPNARDATVWVPPICRSCFVVLLVSLLRHAERRAASRRRQRERPEARAA